MRGSAELAICRDTTKQNPGGVPFAHCGECGFFRLSTRCKEKEPATVDGSSLYTHSRLGYRRKTKLKRIRDRMGAERRQELQLVFW